MHKREVLSFILLSFAYPAIAAADDLPETTDRQPDVTQEESRRCDGGETVEYAYQPIPVAEVPSTFRESGWKSTDIERCSLRVDSAERDEDEPRRGFVVHGEPSDSDDSAFDVVFTDSGEFYVDIRDDEFVLDAEKWLHEDHLEIWTAPKREVDVTDDVGRCCRQDGGPNHWALLLGDGELVNGEGDLDEKIQFEVERIEDDGGVSRIRVKGRLPEGAGDLVTVVYSDSDDGENQERMTATSALEYGDGMTVGALDRSIRCDVQSGTLLPTGKVSTDRADIPEGALEAICGGADNVDGAKCLQCPSYTSMGKQKRGPDPFHPEVVELSIDGRTAYATSWGRETCEMGVAGKKSIVLVLQDSKTWKRVDHKIALSIDECRNIDVSGPKPTFLCRPSKISKGFMQASVAIMTADPEGLHVDTLVGTVDSKMKDCSQFGSDGSKVIKQEGIDEVEYDEDREVVEVKAMARHVKVSKVKESRVCTEGTDHLPDLREYQLEFPYEEGQFQRPEKLVESDGSLKDIPVHDESADE